MTQERQEHIALLVDEARLTLDELAASCMASREWVIERVQTGVLAAGLSTDSRTPAAPAASDPLLWAFSGADVRRARHLCRLERDFDANPELAALVADMMDELERLRARLRRLGASLD